MSTVPMIDRFNGTAPSSPVGFLGGVAAGVRRQLGSLVNEGEEDEADQAEEALEDMMRIKNSFTELFDDLSQGRICDGATDGTYLIRRKDPKQEFLAVLNEQLPLPSGVYAASTEFNRLQEQINQLKQVAQEAQKEIKSLAPNTNERQDKSTDKADESMGIVAAIKELDDLEKEAFKKLNSKHESWSVDDIIKYVGLPGSIPSNVMNAMTFEVTCKIEDRMLRKSRFVSSRRFQSRFFKMNVKAMESTPHMMIFHNDVKQEEINLPEGIHRAFSSPTDRHYRDEIEMWNELAPEEVNWRSRVLGAGLCEMKLNWCCALELFGLSKSESDEDMASINQLRLLRALANSKGSPSPLKTVLGRAIVVKAWHDCQASINYHRFMDLFCLILCYYLARHFRTSQAPDFDNNNMLIITLLTVFAIFTIFSKMVELYQSTRVYGLLVGPWVYFTIWNAFFFGCEVFNSLIVLIPITIMIGGDGKQTIHDFLFQHPVFFAMSIFARWIYLIFGCLSTDSFGHTVLPAFFAVTSKDSALFISFMVLIILGMTTSYWVLPIQDNTAFFDTLIKIFRLGALGDFDINDLEGVNQVIVTENVNGANVTMLEDPEAGTQDLADFHYGVRLLFAIFSVLCTIMIMNVYIGLLSGEYVRAKTDVKTALASFRLRIAIPVLLKNRFWRKVWRKWSPMELEEDPPNLQGVWISMPADELSNTDSGAE